ncbi:hypothetical protein WJX82_008196 [Trebouxia sp. C0006]
MSLLAGAPSDLQAARESILGLWDVNRAQEKTAEKEEVRERRHRASQEGFIEAAPEVPSVDALLRQRLSMSKWKGAVKAVGAVNKMGMLVKMRPPSAPTLIKQGHSMEAVADVVGYGAQSVPARMNALTNEDEWEARTMMPDSGVSTADDPHAEGWQLGMPFSVETKEGHAEAAMAPVVLPNALRKPSNVLQVLATPAWPVGEESDLVRLERLHGANSNLSDPVLRTSSNLSTVMQHWKPMPQEGEGPAVEEKPALSLLDKIRGKRHSSSDQPSPSPNTPGKRASFDSGISGQKRDENLMSSLLNKRANDSQTSIDSSRGSEAVLISAAFADSPLAASLHHHSDNDLLGLSNRAAGPGSVQSDMTDEGSTGSRLAGRPAAGWKGRMSSMLLRNPSTSLKADTIKAKKEKPTLNVLIPTTSIPSANKGGLSTPKSPVSRLGAAPKAGRKARRASNLAQLAEQAGASFLDALEKNSTPGEVVEKNLGHRKSVEDLRSIINTSLTARRWQSKTVSKALPALAPFVPRMLRDDLLTAQPRCLAGSAGHTSHPEQPDEDNDRSTSRGMEPRMESFDGAVLICDITGFTQLTEQLSKQGPSGVEQLTKCMNNYFTKVIDLILLYDGDVMKFAGDSMIVAFSPSNEEKTAEDGGLKEATLRCMHCASDLVDKYGSMRMMASGDVIAIPLAERLREKARAARMAATVPSRADHPEPAVAIAPLVAEGAVAFAVAGAAHRHQVLASPSQSGASTPESRWHSAFGSTAGIFSGSPGTAWHRARAVSAPNAADLVALRAAQSKPVAATGLNAVSPHEDVVSPAATEPGLAAIAASADDATSKEASGPPVVGLLQQVNQKLRLAQVFGRSWSAREARESPTPLQREGESLHPLGGITPLTSQLPLADGSLDKIESPGSPASRVDSSGHSRVQRSVSHLSSQSLLRNMPTEGLASSLVSNRPPHLPKSASFMQVRPPAKPGRLSGELPKIPKKRLSRLNLSPVLPEQDPLEGTDDPASPETQDAAKSASLLPPPEPARQHPFAIEDPIQLPHSPSGFDPGDRFNLHKIRLAPLQTRLDAPHRQSPMGIAALQGRPVPFSEGLRSAPGPVAEGLEVDASAASAVSEAGMSDAGSSVAGDNPQGSAWGAFKGAFWKRKSQAPIGSSGLSQPSMSGHGVHWDVSQTRASATTFSIGSGSAVQRSGASMNSVGTHLGSSTGQGLVSATYSPLSHQGSLLRKDVDNQKNLRQADLNSVKRTPLSLKVTVGCGKVCLFYVGGCAEFTTQDGGVPRWEFFIGDRPHHPGPDKHGRRPPIAQIGSAEQYAQAGDVILSPEVAAVAAGLCTVDALESNDARLVSMSQQAVRVPGKQLEPVQYLSDFQELPRYVQLRAVQILRMHVMGNVRQRIEAGHRDFVNEIRVCTCLFLGFPSLKRPTASSNPTDTSQDDVSVSEVTEVQAAVDLVQKQMRIYDGSFLQFRCDEKGFLSICAFGLPGKTHEDSPARAIQAALSIVEGMKAVGGQGCIGVTTGQLLCACVGSRIRAEYTVFGDSINLSARLMCKATAGMGDILCDYSTQHMATAAAVYTRLEPLVVKGKLYPVDVYSVAPLRNNEGGIQADSASGRRGRKQRRAGTQGLAATSGPVALSGNRTRSTDTISKIKFKQMVGRQNEIQQVTERLTRLVRHKQGGIIVVEGEPGMGKTRLLEELEHESMDHRQSLDAAAPGELPSIRKMCNIFVANGDHANKSKVLHPWRRIFQQMFNHDRMAGPLYCMWDPDLSTNHPVVTQLGARCRAATDDYAAWQALLINTLDMQVEDLPVAPATLPGSLGGTAAHTPRTPRNVRIRTSFEGLGGTPHQDSKDVSESSFSSSRRHTLANRVKRSSSVIIAALPSGGRWSSNAASNQVSRSHGSTGSFEVTDPQILDDAMGFTPRLAGAMTIRPGGPAQSGAGRRSMEGSLHRSATQESMAASTSGPAWLEMSHDLRAQRAKEVLLQVLKEFVAAYGPLAIMLEDLHHFDSISWHFLTTVVENLSEQVLVVTTMRPDDGVLAAASRHEEGRAVLFESAQQSLKAIRSLPSYEQMVLQPFTTAEVQQYMRVALDRQNISDHVAGAVRERTGGLPLYVEQAVLYLQNNNNLLEEGTELGEQDLLAFSNIRVSIHHVITDRIDHLRPSQQLTLKVASVMGLMAVALDLLLRIHPMSNGQEELKEMSSSRQDLKNDMQELEAAGFLKPCKETPDSWDFAQVLARDVAYDLIPFAQRRGLHARLAEALETSLPRASATTIAFHYSKSCHAVEAAEWKRAVKAIQFWEMAAEEAMEGIDHHQALRLFKKAEILLETMNKELDKSRVMSNRPPRSGAALQRTSSTLGMPQTPGPTLVPVSRVRHARWNRHMASMWMQAGNVDTGRFHSLRALHILGAPLPVAEEVDNQGTCLCCPCGSALFLIGRQGRAGLQPASNQIGSVTELTTTNWTDRPSCASQSDAASLPSVSSDLRNEFKDHSNEERQEAAAVLMLLVNAELQIEPPDPEAFRYIMQTCCYFEDLDYGSRIGSSSPMYGVSQKCRMALKTLRSRNRQRFFHLPGRFDSRAQAVKSPVMSGKHAADNRIHPISSQTV